MLESAACYANEGQCGQLEPDGAFPAFDEYLVGFRRSWAYGSRPAVKLGRLMRRAKAAEDDSQAKSSLHAHLLGRVQCHSFRQPQLCQDSSIRECPIRLLQAMLVAFQRPGLSVRAEIARLSRAPRPRCVDCPTKTPQRVDTTIQS